MSALRKSGRRTRLGRDVASLSASAESMFTHGVTLQPWTRFMTNSAAQSAFDLPTSLGLCGIPTARTHVSLVSAAAVTVVVVERVPHRKRNCLFKFEMSIVSMSTT